MKIVNRDIYDICGDSDNFESDLKKANIEFKKIKGVQVYEFGIWGGLTYDFYDYKRKDGQRVLTCATWYGGGDELTEEILLFLLSDNEVYDIEEVCEKIREYNLRSGTARA